MLAGTLHLCLESRIKSPGDRNVHVNTRGHVNQYTSCQYRGQAKGREFPAIPAKGEFVTVKGIPVRASHGKVPFTVPHHESRCKDRVRKSAVQNRGEIRATSGELYGIPRLANVENPQIELHLQGGHKADERVVKGKGRGAMRGVGSAEGFWHNLAQFVMFSGGFPFPLDGSIVKSCAMCRLLSLFWGDPQGNRIESG